MQLFYENQGNNTYLTYRLGNDDELDTMSLGMLTNNRIPGLAATLFTQIDTEKFVKYNVSAKVSVKQFFSGPVNKKRLVGVFSGIADAMLSAEEYMIDPATILLDMEYIFTDVSTCETVLICLPIYEEGKAAVSMDAFFKNIMFSTQFDQTENCDHIARIINYLNSTPVFSLVDFKALLDELKNGSAPAAPVYQQPVATAPQPVVAPPKPVAPPQPAAPVAHPVAPQPVQQRPAAHQPAVRPVQQPVAPQPPVQQRPVPQPPVQRPAAHQPAQPGFAVPGKPAAPAAPAAPVANGGKEISFMYLMQHYNKENAAAYKAQQAAKKGKSAPAAPAAPQPARPAAPAPQPGFAVPGQNLPGRAPGVPVPPAAPVPPVQRPVPPVQQPVAQPVQRPVPPQPVQPKPVVPVQQHVQPAAPQPVPAPQPGFAMNFGETTVLGGGNVGETTVLGAAPVAEVAVKPYLIRAKNNERITLDKPVFRIGKEKSYVDYFIGDNTAISRSHANIIAKDGEYYVVDTNSTNHTYVNGGMIQSNVETRITHDTRIRLANEEFTFKLK